MSNSVTSKRLFRNVAHPLLVASALSLSGFGSVINASSDPVESMVAQAATEAPGAGARNAWIMLEAPGLQGSMPIIRTEGDIHRIIEYGIWQHSSQKWPRAELMFARIGDLVHGSQTFTRGDALSTLIPQWFKTESVQLGEAGTALNRFEELEFQRFTLGNSVPCIFIRQGRDTTGELNDLIGPGEILGDMKIMGWYCAAPGTGELDTVFAGFVNGIGVKGFATPEPPHANSELRTRRR